VAILGCVAILSVLVFIVWIVINPQRIAAVERLIAICLGRTPSGLHDSSSYQLEGFLAEYGPMAPSLTLRQATTDELEVIIRLIEGAADWLSTKGTDQWAQPWPDRAGRDGRILTHLGSGKTWICWDRGTPVATITADPDEDPYWPERQRREPAIYISRLVVSRAYAGAGLGAELINWAGRKARHDYGAQWIRVSAWTTNQGLHAYYRGQGFELCGFHSDDGYPSGALFQKPTAGLPASGPGLFSVSRLPGPRG
jgi:GNAT superfamily N-acetyltransferase